MIIVSRCLLGKKSKYNGGDNYTEAVVKYLQSYACIGICPENVYLPVPRDPAEIRKNTADGSLRVINISDIDVTQEYVDGALDTLRIIEKRAVDTGEIIEGAILKAKSPSCGYGNVYDGTFSHTLIEGNGIFVQMLIEEVGKFRRGEGTLVQGASFAETFRIADESNFNEIFEHDNNRATSILR